MDGLKRKRKHRSEERYSENRGTLFFQSKTPREEILRTLSLFPEKERYPRVLVEQLDMIRTRS